MKRNVFSKHDLLLLLPLLLAALAAFLLLSNRQGTGARHAVVTYGSETVLDIDIDALKEPETYTFGSVTVEIGPEGAQVLSSGCPDQICVRTGLLTKSGDTAACVPERVAVKIVSATNEVDAVAY